MWGMKFCSNVQGHMTMPMYDKKIKKTGSNFPNASAWVKAYTAWSAHVFPTLF